MKNKSPFFWQHESDLNDFVRLIGQGQQSNTDVADADQASQVFRTLGRTVRLGRLLQRKILEPLLPGEG